MLLAVGLLTAFLAIAAILPFLPLAHGLVRIGDFPRQQFLILAGIVLAASFALSDGSAWWMAIQAALALICLIHAWHILPYLPVWRRQSASFDPARDKGETFRLVACNVKMSNGRFADMEREIARHDPDILLLMEVDDRWMRGLGDLVVSYPHVLARPQDNSFGIVMATRFDIVDARVDCLLTEGVPSIDTIVELPSGKRFRMFCLHPEPPVPHHVTTGRDGETSLIAFKARRETLPVIVSGDLNDVAWSRTTQRFRRISRLLDPRIGRTVFSTFDARNPVLRWPLDHLFHSPQFRLKRMDRLAPCGSDHFPVLFDLVLCEEPAAETLPDPANGEDMRRARKHVGRARERGDGPIGGDWE